jgi:hypothetical protein
LAQIFVLANAANAIAAAAVSEACVPGSAINLINQLDLFHVRGDF